MLVAGLCRGHDASATLILDGKLLVVAEAERELGVKHADGLGAAAAALNAALRQVGRTASEVDVIVIADNYRDNFEKSPGVVAATHQGSALFAIGTVAHMQHFGGEVGLAGLKSDTPIYCCCHHFSHAIGSYFLSGFDAASALVTDGYGICAGTAAYSFQGTKWKRLAAWDDKFLLGWRYQLFGEFISEIDKSKTLVYDLAGKVMGLQAYGVPTEVEYFEKWLTQPGFAEYEKCWAAGSMSYFKEIDDSGLGLTRNSTNAKDPKYLNLLASMQSAFSKVLCEAVEELCNQTGINKVVLSGGCALNVVSNTAIAKKIGWKNIFIPPNAGDSGLSVGAAVIGALNLDKNPFVKTPKNVRRSPFLGLSLDYDVGPDYTAKGLSKVKRNLSIRSDLIELSENIVAGAIIGIISGRCEVGPRALGHRSIIAYPAHPGIKDLINSKIKVREWWRPFAPVCRECDVEKYFDIIAPCEYMLYSAHVKPEWREKLPSITHIDGSARLQIIKNKEDNPVLWEILQYLNDVDKCAVLLNTSFNLGGRPIVNRLSEVFEMLIASKLDAALVENDLIFKKSQYSINNTRKGWFGI
jgi:carbamoyltransferase